MSTDAPTVEQDTPDDIGEILENLEQVAAAEEGIPGEASGAIEAHQQAAAAESQKQYEEVLTMCLGMTFGIVAPNWNVTEAESKELAKAYAGVLDKYFPGGMQSFGVEVGAALVTVAVIAPRIGKPRLPVEPRQTDRVQPHES